MNWVQDAELQRVVRSAVERDEIASAVIFVARPDSGVLELAAAAGIEGPALDGLVAAVRNPGHPISRTLLDEAPTYDVKPTAPGGPALRSHLPIRARVDGRSTVAGVLALAHQESLDADARAALERLVADLEDESA